MSAAKILLQAGLLCDRKTLQNLSNNRASGGAPSQVPIWKEVGDTNIFEVDREYWRRFKRGLVTDENTPQSKLSDDSDSSYDSCASATDTIPDASTKRKRVQRQFHTDTRIYEFNGSTELHRAAKAGNTELVSKLISAGANCDARDRLGQSPLHWAAALGYVDVYELLSNFVQNGNPIVDSMGRTPLHLAAFRGSIEVVVSIHTKSSKSGIMDVSDHEGYSPLLSAALAGQLTCLEYLLRCGPEVDAFRTTHMGMSALHLACHSRSSSAVSMLLKRGLDPNAPSKDGSTALHYASPLHEGEVVKLLLEAHADPAVQRADGNLPIHVIFSSPNLPGPGHPFSIRHLDVNDSALLSKDFVDRKNNNGDTTLHLACKDVVRYNKPPNWISLLLLQQGCDPLIENNDGYSSLEILLVRFKSKHSVPPFRESLISGAVEAILQKVQDFARVNIPIGTRKMALKVLSRAIEHAEWHLCESLIELVDDTSEIDTLSMMSPLLHACQQNCSQKLFQKIVSKSSDLSRYDEHGYTALHRAVMENQLVWVRVLVSRGADVNQHAENTNRATPLLLCHTGRETGQRIAQHLIASGADINLRNSTGYSPIQKICADGGLNVLELVSREEIIAVGRIRFLEGTNTWHGMRCFHLAALGGHLDVASFLLERKIAEINEATEEELMTALHIAAHKGNISLAKHLVQAGAAINLKNARGETPFQTALRKHEADMMDYLLQNGASVGAEGQSAVWMEVVGWDNLRVRHILKRSFKQTHESQDLSLSDVLQNYQGPSNDASVRQILQEGLKYAIEGGNSTLVSKILRRGLNLDVPMDDCGKCGPLLYALRLGQALIAHQLIEAGCSLDVAACHDHEIFGFDPAHYSAWHGNRYLLALILSKGYTCKAAVHPIHVAILMKHKSCVELILDHISLPIQKTAMIISQSPSPPDPSAKAPVSDSNLEESDAEDSNSDSNSDSDSKDSSTLVNGHSPPQLESRRPSNIIFDFPIKADLLSWPWTSISYEKGSSPMVGWTALHLAVKESEETIVHLLIRYGASVDATDPLHRTPLHIAAETGNMSIVDVLLEKGASETAITTRGETPLFLAIESRRLRVAKRLVNPRTMDIRNTHGRSPLHGFAEFGNEPGLDGVRQLLKLGVDIEAVDDAGRTPLLLAAKAADHIPTMLCLLKHGANVHKRDNFGQTPLFYAVEQGSLENCTTLVEYGASIDAVDIFRITILHIALHRGSRIIVEWIVQNQPSLLSMKSSIGCTPVHLALVSPNMQRWALDQCPDLILDCDDDCGSLLHAACRRGRLWTVKKIIKRLSRNELYDLCRKTTALVPSPLTLAVLSGHFPIVQRLLDAGVDMNIAHPPWETPLTEAVKYRREEIARLLLEHSYEALHEDNEEEDALNKKDGSDEKDISSEADAASAKAAWVDKKLAELLSKANGEAL